MLKYALKNAINKQNKIARQEEKINKELAKNNSQLQSLFVNSEQSEDFTKVLHYICRFFEVSGCDNRVMNKIKKMLDGELKINDQIVNVGPLSGDTIINMFDYNLSLLKDLNNRKNIIDPNNRILYDIAVISNGYYDYKKQVEENLRRNISIDILLGDFDS